MKLRNAKPAVDDVSSGSPDVLIAAPKRGEGVRRLNNVPMIIAGVFLLGAGGVVAYSLNARNHQGKGGQAAVEQAKGNERGPAGVSRPEVLEHAPEAGLILAADDTAVGAGDEPIVLIDNQVPQSSSQGPGSYVPAPAPEGQGASPYEAQWQQYYQQQAAIRQARLERTQTALTADMRVEMPRSGGETTKAPLSPMAAALEAIRQQQVAQMPPPPLGSGAGAGAPMPPLSAQAQKRAFMSEAAESTSYSSSRLQAPQSRTELKAGTVIPAVMIGGIKSDLPGQIVGQVSRNVYDSTSGRFLLIPQGSRLVGTYDSTVGYGEKRLLVAWKRLILPDGSSFDLGAMPGADSAGYAGFKDRVNTHFAKAMSSALMVSLFSAGIQLSQPQAANGENVSSGQTAAAAVGQELGQFAMERARKDLNIQPELTIRPGYRFNVQVTKDLIMQEWRGR